MKCFIAWFCIALIAPCILGAAETLEAKPNVIVFLVDDMGWMDSGVYGSRYYETPHIDALAKRGMLFTNAYAANPLCSPTRASILTGKYPARLGLTTAAGHQPPRPAAIADTAPPTQQVITPESKTYLDSTEYTLAEAMRDAGYRTAHVGKWHLGLTEPHWPEQQGYDFAFHGKPDPGPGSSYFAPYEFRAYRSFKDGPPGEYITDRITDEAIKFIEAGGDKPFLLSLWQYGVHGPWGHKEEYTRAFAKKTDPTGRQGNPIMASMLKSVDESLGRVVAALDRLKLTDRTIILFSSDNGGNVHSNIPGDRKRDETSEFIKDWRKWAGDRPPTNNAPLRAGKSWLYEGGVSVPLIVVWPGKIQPGTRTDALACSIDFYPTLLELTGVPANPKQRFDGISLAPVLLGKGKLQRDTLFNYFPHGGGGKPPGVSVRQGDWKLIRWFETSATFPQRHELYNLKDDLSETKNLAAEVPEKVKVLNALIDAFLRDTGALAPKSNPAYNRAAAAATAAPRRAINSEDALNGWVPKFIAAETVDGAARLTGEGRRPFLGRTGLDRFDAAGALTLKLRIRAAAGGPGQIQWRSADQEKFPATGQTVDFTVPAGGEFSMVSVPFTIEGKLMHMRVYLPAAQGGVDVDWMRIDSAAGKPLVQWDLGGTSAK